MRIPDHADHDRLDRWLATLARITRGEARRRIEQGAVRVDGRRCRIASRIVGPGARLGLERAEPARPPGKQPVVLFRDEYLAVVDKPPGMPVQPTRASVHGTLEEWLLDQAGISYAAFHHRLDRDARGLLAVAIHRDANRGLAAAFAGRTAERRYRVLVNGLPASDSGQWRHIEGLRLGRRTAGPWTEPEAGEHGAAQGDSAAGHPSRRTGREMLASWTLSERRGPHSLLVVRLHTGRTHQVRLQAAAEGLPVVGDRLYGLREDVDLRLQAFALGLAHPVTGAALSWELEEPPEWGGEPGPARQRTGR